MFKKLLAGAGIAAAAVAALPASVCAETAIGGLGCGLGNIGMGSLGCGLGAGWNILPGGLGCFGFGMGISLPYWGMPWSWW